MEGAMIFIQCWLALNILLLLYVLIPVAIRGEL